MKTLLITGCNGQLGREMRNVLSERESEYNVIYTDVEELNITDEQAVESFFAQNHIDVVVNCAAYTAVDKAESEPELCNLINCVAVENLAKAAKAHGAKLIHVSTDYVFDGNGTSPYQEDAPTCPKSVYGSTKLAGEIAISKILGEDCAIVRTAWLYSPYGKNFVKTMLNLGRTTSTLTVVADQVGTPTYALDLAKAIMAIIAHDAWCGGIYHFTDEGVTNWCEFTREIHRQAGITGCEVKAITTDQYPTAAKRPAYSVLDKSKIKNTFGINIPQWQDSLTHCLRRMGEI